MKTTFQTITAVLIALFPVVAESAVVAPGGGAHVSATRTFRANRSFNGFMSSRSFNSSVDTTFNNGSSGLTLARPVNGMPTFNVTGLATPPLSSSVNATVTRSFNSPFGGESSNSMFSGTIQGSGVGPFNLATNGTLNPFGSGGLINQPIGGPVVPFTSAPNFAGAAAFSPAAFGDGGGDYGDDGGPPETPESAALKGQADVTSAAGKYNQATSAAAIKATEADNLELKNATGRVRTYYAARDAGRIARENERGNRPGAEELARRAHEAAPRTLTSNQIDPVSGNVRWPAFFKAARFDQQRSAVNDSAVNWVREGQLNFDDRAQMRENIGGLFTALKSQISAMPPKEYLECRSFLESLLNSTAHSALDTPQRRQASCPAARQNKQVPLLNCFDKTLVFDESYAQFIFIMFHALRGANQCRILDHFGAVYPLKLEFDGRD